MKLKIDDKKKMAVSQPTKKSSGIGVNDAAIYKMLYGAGSNGWTKEWYDRILTAYDDNSLIITGCREDVNLLLAEHKDESDFSNEERLLIMLFARPQVKVKMGENEKAGSVVLSLEWHRLTDFRHIDEVKEYYPAIYNRWADAGMIPNVEAKNEWNNYFDTEDDQAFLDKLRKEVPADSALRQPHDDWFKEYKNGR